MTQTTARQKVSNLEAGYAAECVVSDGSEFQLLKNTVGCPRFLNSRLKQRVFGASLLRHEANASSASLMLDRLGSGT